MAGGEPTERARVLAWSRHDPATPPPPPPEDEDTLLRFLQQDPYFYRVPPPPPNLQFHARAPAPKRRRY